MRYHQPLSAEITPHVTSISEPQLLINVCVELITTTGSSATWNRSQSSTYTNSTSVNNYFEIEDLILLSNLFVCNISNIIELNIVHMSEPLALPCNSSCR